MRLTPNKVAKWHAKIERAGALLESVHRDVSADRMKAKGGDLSVLTDLSNDLLVARGKLRHAEGTAEALVTRQTRREGER